MKRIKFPLLIAVLVGFAAIAHAGLNEAKAAYKRGDYATAFKEFKAAADQGNANAEYDLGLMYQKGQGVPKNYAEAAEWYRKAAEQGNAVAQDNLGFMYANGLGIPMDNAEAMKWWSKASDQGDANAQNNLRIMLLSNMARPLGNGPSAEKPGDRKAVAQGNANTQNNLGTTSTLEGGLAAEKRDDNKAAAAVATPRPQASTATGIALGSALDAAMRADIAEVTKSIRDNGFPGAADWGGVYMGPGAAAKQNEEDLKQLLDDPTARNIATKYLVGSFYYQSLPRIQNAGEGDWDKNANATKARRWFQIIADQIKANPNVPLPPNLTKDSIKSPLQSIDDELAAERQRNEAAVENARNEAQTAAQVQAQFAKDIREEIRLRCDQRGGAEVAVLSIDTLGNMVLLNGGPPEGRWWRNGYKYTEKLDFEFGAACQVRWTEYVQVSPGEIIFGENGVNLNSCGGYYTYDLSNYNARTLVNTDPPGTRHINIAFNINRTTGISTGILNFSPRTYQCQKITGNAF